MIKINLLLSFSKQLSKFHWFLILFFSLVIYLSLDLNSYFRSIGDSSSNIPPSAPPFSIFIQIGVFIFIFAIFTIIAHIQLIKSKSLHQTIVITWREVACFAFPLFLSTTIVWLSFWPASTAWDGSLYWSNAALHEIYTPYDRTMALFMRLFTYISSSPGWLILFQNVFAAMGVSLILKELRYRGISRWVAQSCTIVLAILPQYPIFFNNLGSDALSTIGILFLVWALLSITRHLKLGKLNYLSFFIVIIAAVFSSLMRVDMMPTATFSILLLCVFLFLHGKRLISIMVCILFSASVLFIPKITVMLSTEKQTMQHTQKISEANNLPQFYLFLDNFYIFNFFRAAIHSGVQLEASDTDLFYKIAPRSIWKNYTCYMADPYLIDPFSKESLLRPEDHKNFQRDLFATIFRILKKNPSVLIDHELCITKILWYIGYGQVPFLAPPTLGYDNVKEQFKLLAGENKAILSNTIRGKISFYYSRSMSHQNFWFFWKPALILYFGLFCVLFRLTMQYDNGLLFMLLIPATRLLVLIAFIPFPGYRYVYPAILVMSLLCTFAFTPANRESTVIKQIESPEITKD